MTADQREQRTDEELLDALEQARPGVERGRALHAARRAVERQPNRATAVAAGRRMAAERR